MYLKFKRIIRKYGVDLTVYPYSSPKNQPKFHYVGGRRVPVEDDKQPEPLKLHEPVAPPDKTSFSAQFVNGGELTQADLIWVSTHKVPINSIVEVPSQPDTKYRVTDYANYQAYSDAAIYLLKGDSQHQDGR